MFEKYKVPAFFLVKNAALAAFASGRSTALVIDSGATHTTAVPVLDGYVISNAVVKSPLGGDYLILRSREMLESLGIDLTPTALVASKDILRDKEKPKYTKKNLSFTPTNSWMVYMVKKTVQDFQQSVLQVIRTVIISEQIIDFNFYRFLSHLMMKGLLQEHLLLIMNFQQDTTKFWIRTF